MKLYIKNMVCDRCVMVLREEMERLGLTLRRIVLGEVDIEEDELSGDQLQRLDEILKKNGFERIDDQRSRLIESVKSKVIQMIHHSENLEMRENWSTLLSEQFHVEYSHLSTLFSSVQGITLEQYIIRQKIEKVKELLFYDELNLSEISHRLGYSSVAHLSSQFKKITGLTPSEMKKARDIDRQRRSIDSIS